MQEVGEEGKVDQVAIACIACLAVGRDRLTQGWRGLAVNRAFVEAAIAQLFLEKGHQLTGAIHADEPVLDFALDLAVFRADAQTGPVGLAGQAAKNFDCSEFHHIAQGLRRAIGTLEGCTEIDADLADGGFAV